MISLCRATKELVLQKTPQPLLDCNIQMQHFDTTKMAVMTDDPFINNILPYKDIVSEMLSGINLLGNTAYLTVHGKHLKKGEILRRGGKHIDGNYDPDIFNWTCNGVDFDKYLNKEAPPVDSEHHQILYNSNRGGVLLLTNYEACLGWTGEFDGTAGLGGSCDHIETGEPFILQRNKVYYGNSTFIHESIPVKEDVYRIMFRITLPRNHIYSPQ